MSTPLSRSRGRSPTRRVATDRVPQSAAYGENGSRDSGEALGVRFADQSNDPRLVTPTSVASAEEAQRYPSRIPQPAQAYRRSVSPQRQYTSRGHLVSSPSRGGARSLSPQRRTYPRQQQPQQTRQQHPVAPAPASARFGYPAVSAQAPDTVHAPAPVQTVALPVKEISTLRQVQSADNQDDAAAEAPETPPRTSSWWSWMSGGGSKSEDKDSTPTTTNADDPTLSKASVYQSPQLQQDHQVLTEPVHPAEQGHHQHHHSHEYYGADDSVLTDDQLSGQAPPPLRMFHNSQQHHEDDKAFKARSLPKSTHHYRPPAKAQTQTIASPRKINTAGSLDHQSASSDASSSGRHATATTSTASNSMMDNPKLYQPRQPSKRKQGTLRTFPKDTEDVPFRAFQTVGRESLETDDDTPHHGHGVHQAPVVVQNTAGYQDPKTFHARRLPASTFVYQPPKKPPPPTLVLRRQRQQQEQHERELQEQMEREHQEQLQREQRHQMELQRQQMEQQQRQQPQPQQQQEQHQVTFSSSVPGPDAANPPLRLAPPPQPQRRVPPMMKKPPPKQRSILVPLLVAVSLALGLGSFAALEYLRRERMNTVATQRSAMETAVATQVVQDVVRNEAIETNDAPVTADNTASDTPTDDSPKDAVADETPNDTATDTETTTNAAAANNADTKTNTAADKADTTKDPNVCTEGDDTCTTTTTTTARISTEESSTNHRRWGRGKKH